MKSLIENLKDNLVASATDTVTMLASLSSMAGVSLLDSSVSQMIGAALLDTKPYRRLLEKWYVFIKADLDLPATCKATRAALLTHLQNKDVFTDEFIAHFTADPISSPEERDSADIRAIKNTLQALSHLESTFQTLHDINANPDQHSIILLSHVLSTLRSAVATVSTELHVLHQSSAEVETLIGSYVGPLISKLNILASSVHSFDLNQVPVLSIDQLMQQLPKKAPEDNAGLKNLSQLIYQLPTIFDDLHQLIIQDPQPKISSHEPETKNIDSLHANLTQLATRRAVGSAEPTSDPERSISNQINQFIPAPLNQLAGKTTEQLNQISKQVKGLIPKQISDATDKVTDKLNGLSNALSDMSQSASATVPLLNTVLLLKNLLPQLINTGAPVTKDAYKQLVGLLTQLRREYLPSIIAELENLGDHFHLRDTLLIEPTLKSMNDFYNELAKWSESLAAISDKADEAAKLSGTIMGKITPGEALEPRVGPNILCDDAFIKAIQDRRVAHFESFEISAQSIATKLIAAEHFFTQALELLGEEPDNIPDETMKTFVNNYQLIQPYYAKLHPEMDVRFVDHLELWLKNPEARKGWFDKVGLEKTKKSLLSLMIQDMSQAALNADEINNHAKKRDELYRHIQNQEMFKIELIKTVNEFRDTVYLEVTPSVLARASASVGAIASTVSSAMTGIRTAIMPPSSHEEKKTENNQGPLILQYERIRPYYAKLYPDMDERFRTDLSAWLKMVKSDKGDHSIQSFLSKLTSLTASEIYLIDNKQRDQIYAPPPSTEQIFPDNRNYEDNIKKTNEILFGKPLESMANHLEGKPPLEQILALKLSEKLKHFMDNQLKPWAEKTLDSSIFDRLTFDSKKIPETVIKNNLLQTYTEIQPALLYKKLVFSLDVVQKGLAQLEYLYEHGDFNTITGTYQTINSIGDLSHWPNIYYAILCITDINSSPQLKAIIGEGLECLAPLKGIPVLGDYIKSMHTEPIKTTISNDDIVSRWKTQINIVRKTLGQAVVEDASLSDKKNVVNHSIDSSAVSRDRDESTSTGQAVSDIRDGLSVTTQNEEMTLQNIAETLYKIPQLLRQHNPDKTNAPELTQDELTQKAFALMALIKNMQPDLKTLKNILSSVNEVHEALSLVGVETRDLAVSKMTTARNTLGLELSYFVDEAEFQLCFKPGILSTGVSDAVNDFYYTLLADFPTDLISEDEKLDLVSRTGLIDQRIERETQRLNALPDEQLVNVEQMKKDLNEGYQKLRAIEKNGFSTPETQEAFLRAYQTLQPYLNQIQSKYDPQAILRTLQAPQDFQKHFDDIQELKGQVFQLIEQENNNYANMQKRRTERIDYFKTLKDTKEKEVQEKTIPLFKLDLEFKAAFKNADRVLQEQDKKHVLLLFDQTQKISNKNLVDEIRKNMHLNVDIKNTASVIVSPPVIGSVSEATQDSVPRTQACFADARNDGASVSSETITKAKNTIQTKVKALYSNYSTLMEGYIHLDQMKKDIASFPGLENTFQKDKESLLNIDKSLDERVSLAKDSLNCCSQIVTLYQQLETMHVYIDSHPSAEPEVSQKKIATIDEMQKILLNDTVTPSKRLQEVINMATSTETNEILEKKASYTFLGLIRKLRDLCFNQTAPSFSSLKQNLNSTVAACTNITKQYREQFQQMTRTDLNTEEGSPCVTPAPSTKQSNH